MPCLAWCRPYVTLLLPPTDLGIFSCQCGIPNGKRLKLQFPFFFEIQLRQPMKLVQGLVTWYQGYSHFYASIELFHCIHLRRSLLEDTFSLCGLLPYGHSETGGRHLCLGSSDCSRGLGRLTSPPVLISLKTTSALYCRISLVGVPWVFMALLSSTLDPGQQFIVKQENSSAVHWVNSLCLLLSLAWVQQSLLGLPSQSVQLSLETVSALYC